MNPFLWPFLLSGLQRSMGGSAANGLGAGGTDRTAEIAALLGMAARPTDFNMRPPKPQLGNDFSYRGYDHRPVPMGPRNQYGKDQGIFVSPQTPRDLRAPDRIPYNLPNIADLQPGFLRDREKDRVRRVY